MFFFKQQRKCLNETNLEVQPNCIIEKNCHRKVKILTQTQNTLRVEQSNILLCLAFFLLSCFHDPLPLTVRLMINPKCRLCSTSKFHAKFQSQLNSEIIIMVGNVYFPKGRGWMNEEFAAAWRSPGLRIPQKNFW